MSAAGEALFGRSPWIFWVLAPALLLGALAITLPPDYPDAWHLGTVLVCDAAALCLALALWPYHRVPGTARLLCGLVAASYGVYLLDAWLPGRIGPDDAAPSDPGLATAGFVVIGFPCLWFALRGRWPTAGARAEPPRVSFDGEAVRLAGLGPEELRFPWRSVVRIGYRRIVHLHEEPFLELHLADDPAEDEVLTLPPEWPGVAELAAVVDALPDATRDARDALPERVDASVVVWPSREAGRSLDAVPAAG